MFPSGFKDIVGISGFSTELGGCVEDQVPQFSIIYKLSLFLCSILRFRSYLGSRQTCCLPANRNRLLDAESLGISREPLCQPGARTCPKRQANCPQEMFTGDSGQSYMIFMMGLLLLLADST